MRILPESLDTNPTDYRFGWRIATNARGLLDGIRKAISPAQLFCRIIRRNVSEPIVVLAGGGHACALLRRTRGASHHRSIRNGRLGEYRLSRERRATRGSFRRVAQENRPASERHPQGERQRLALGHQQGNRARCQPGEVAQRRANCQEAFSGRLELRAREAGFCSQEGPAQVPVHWRTGCRKNPSLQPQTAGARSGFQWAACPGAPGICAREEELLGDLQRRAASACAAVACRLSCARSRPPALATARSRAVQAKQTYVCPLSSASAVRVLHRVGGILGLNCGTLIW